jgi:hypothetical protein
MLAHIWHWLSDFMGLNFGQDPFSTHMYNFWSGFGGDITEFAIVGTLIAIYRKHVKSLKSINITLKDVVHRDLGLHKKDKDGETGSEGQVQ